MTIGSFVLDSFSIFSDFISLLLVGLLWIISLKTFHICRGFFMRLLSRLELNERRNLFRVDLTNVEYSMCFSLA